MAAMKFVFCCALAVCVAVSSAFNLDHERGISDICPWCPTWVKCNYTQVQGATCSDCKTKLVCTKIGGIQMKCVWPGKEYCANGDCVAEPSQECATNTTPEPELSTVEQNTPLPELSTITVEQNPSEPPSDVL